MVLSLSLFEASFAWLVSCSICLWNARNHMRADEKREDLDLLFFFVFVPSSLIGHVHRYEGRGWNLQ